MHLTNDCIKILLQLLLLFFCFEKIEKVEKQNNRESDHPLNPGLGALEWWSHLKENPKIIKRKEKEDPKNK